MKFVVEMVSDLVLPGGCWLGLRRIEAARKLAPEVDVQLVFRPFAAWTPERNARRQAVDLQGPTYKEKFRRFIGREPRTAPAPCAPGNWSTIGEAEGIPYHFDKITRRAATVFDAHAAGALATGTGQGPRSQGSAVQSLLEAGRDIGDHEVLNRCGRGDRPCRPGDREADLLKSECPMCRLVREEAETFPPEWA